MGRFYRKSIRVNLTIKMTKPLPEIPVTLEDDEIKNDLISNENLGNDVGNDRVVHNPMTSVASF